MIAPRLFDAFARCYDPPYWVIEEFLRDGPEDFRADLSIALHRVTETERRGTRGFGGYFAEASIVLPTGPDGHMLGQRAGFYCALKR